MATMRWATNPGLSLITVTGTPSLPSRPRAAAMHSGSITGGAISVRRRSSPNRVSIATVRFGSSACASAVAVASSPNGVTRQRAWAEGLSPLSRGASRVAKSFERMAWPPGSAGLTHTHSGRDSGAGASAGISAVASS